MVPPQLLFLDRVRSAASKQEPRHGARQEANALLMNEPAKLQRGESCLSRSSSTSPQGTMRWSARYNLAFIEYSSILRGELLQHDDFSHC